MNTFKGLLTDNYDDFDEFQLNKIAYLNEVYDNTRTQEVYWGIFQRFVRYMELSKNKDLFLFNSEEVEDVLKSIPTSSIRTKRAAWTAIDKYLDWSVQRGYNFTGINQCQNINLDEILTVNRMALSKKIYSMDEIYEIANKAKIQGITSQEILAILLPRYGILGKESSWLINLKWSDIDYENKKIYIIKRFDDLDNREINVVEAIIDIDDNLINWLLEAKEEDGYEVAAKGDSVRKVKFYDNGYVFKSTKSYKLTITKMVIYSYVAKICATLGLNKISISDLVKSRKFDLLNDIYENTGKLFVEDFKNVSELFNPNSSDTTYSSLLKDYKLVNENIKISHSK